ncbi:MAG: hypothetical protein ACI9N1_002695 [Flavobacteriales bacterium]|jgi:hypothetical protein
MVKINFFVIVASLFLMACTTGSDSQKDTQINNLGHYVEFEKLETATMHNNFGPFVLNTDQLGQLKIDLSSMIYIPGMSAKVGGISIEMIIDGEPFMVLSSNNGDYLEVHKTMITKNGSEIKETEWLYFKTNDVNFNNYQKEE